MEKKTEAINAYLIKTRKVGGGGGRGGRKERDRERERETERERQRDRSYSKTLFYNDCSIGLAKNLSNN